MKLSQSVRRTTKQGKMFPAIILDHGGGKATVRLSTNGAIYRMLPLVGGPVKLDQAVYVDFNTDPPQVVAPGEDVIENGEPRTRTRIAPRGVPTEPALPDLIILDPSGQGGEGGDPSLTPPANPVYTWEVDETGLANALETASGSPGCVIYIPDCDMSDIGDALLASEVGHWVPAKTTIIGEGKDKTIIRHPFLLQEGCVLRNLRLDILNPGGHTFTYPHEQSLYNFAVRAFGDCTVQDCDLWVTSTQTGGSGACVTNEISCRVILNNCSIKNHNDTNNAWGVLAGGQAGPYYALEQWYAVPRQNFYPLNNIHVAFFDTELFTDPYLHYSLPNLIDRNSQKYICIVNPQEYYPDDFPTEDQVAKEYHAYFSGVTRIPVKCSPITSVEVEMVLVSGTVPGLRWGGRSEDTNTLHEHTLEPYHTYTSGSTESEYNANTEPISGVSLNVPFRISWDYPSEMLPAGYFTKPQDYVAWDNYWDEWSFNTGCWGSAYPINQAEFQIQLNYVKATGPNGLEHYLFPRKGYFYINNCTFDCEGADIDMQGEGYCEVTGNSQSLSSEGTVVFRNVGQQPVATGSEPPATYPAQWWLQE